MARLGMVLAGSRHQGIHQVTLFDKASVVFVPDLHIGGPSATCVPDGGTVNNIGKLIEERRRLIGMSRAELAAALGVSAQTVLNVERDRSYNLGTKLLLRIEDALGVEFHVVMKEKTTMTDRITMGNDEFILYIRKNYDCKIANPQLGRRIWVWLRDNANGEYASDQRAALWGQSIPAVARTGLPGSATQFEFDRNTMPDLYRFLDQLGSGGDDCEGDEE